MVAASVAVTCDDQFSYFPEVDTDDIRLFAGRVEDHIWTRYKRGGAAGSHRTGHVPGMSGDHAHIGRLDPEALSGHAVRLARGLQSFRHVCRERLLEEVTQAGVLELGLGNFCRRIGQRGQPKAGLDALLEKLDVRDGVTFVIHDWGSALGFDWANRHRDAVKGIAYMEALVLPLTWDDFRPQIRPAFEGLRSPAGEQLVLEQNMFVEQILPGAMFRKLTDEEMREYRRPFAEPGEGRRPTLAWRRQIPIDGEPADVAEIIRSYGDWLSQTSVPKLFMKGEPGALLASGPPLEFCRSWPSQSESTGRGVHFLQEDSPDEIGHAIADWLIGLTR